jgi:hypothetical protein
MQHVMGATVTHFLRLVSYFTGGPGPQNDGHGMGIRLLAASPSQSRPGAGLVLPPGNRVAAPSGSMDLLYFLSGENRTSGE